MQIETTGSPPPSRQNKRPAINALLKTAALYAQVATDLLREVICLLRGDWWRHFVPS